MNSRVEDGQEVGGQAWDAGAAPQEFAADYQPLAVDVSWAVVLDALLKRPATIVWELLQGNTRMSLRFLLPILVATLCVYGVVLASFSGGQQYWFVPLKFAAGCLLSAGICLPSLYVFGSLCGVRQSLGQVAGLLLAALALSGILLVGFGPVAWVFAQSTQAVAFMAVLHLGLSLIALGFGVRLLRRAFEFLSGRTTLVLRLWSVLFLLVAFQMCTILRPLAGPFDGVRLHAKKSFLSHWSDTLRGRSSVTTNTR